MVRVILDSSIRTDVDLTELPCDTKLSFDPFRNYPEFVTADIPADVALEHRRQIQALATQLSPCASVSDLVTTSRDNHDDVMLGNPVINRPWEWMEYLGDPVMDAKEENRNKKEKENPIHSFKNAGAISLEMFGARITGDCIVPNMSEEVDGRMESRIREFEDGLSADTLFRRDWRETRVVDISEGISGPSAQRPTNTEASETGKEIAAGGYTTKVA
jgi:mediator of RNA polymerase II transcription subunit 12